MMSAFESLLQSQWGITGEIRLTPITGGLINRTWRLDWDAGVGVLQWVNPVFPLETSIDVGRVCQYLNDHGVKAPSLIPATGGQMAIPAEGGTLRLMTFIEGGPLDPHLHFHVAAVTLARFHSVLADFPHGFLHNRDIHNTPSHLQLLREVMLTHADHDFFPEVAALAEVVFHHITPLVPPGDLPLRIVHGDPKLENFLLTADGPVLIDLDTVGRHTLFGEIGDAARSWCVRDGHFSLDSYAEFVRAYRSVSALALSEAERQSLGYAHIVIGLELTARFLRDTLLESYFGWDKDKYSRAAEHNLVRAREQLSLSLEALSHRENTVKLWKQA